MRMSDWSSDVCSSDLKVAAWVTATDARVSGQAMYEDMTTDLRPDMAAIATRITLVYPYSAGLPKDRADAFYLAESAKAPNVTFVPVADRAHFLLLDQPARPDKRRAGIVWASW